MYLIVCSFFCLQMNACISWCEILVMVGGGGGKLTGCITWVFGLPCPSAFRSGVECWEKTFFSSDLFMHCCYSTSAAMPSAYLASRQSDYSCNFAMRLISWIEIESRAEEGKMLSPWLYKPLCIELSSLIIVGQSMKYHMLGSRRGVPWLCLCGRTCEFSHSD